MDVALGADHFTQQDAVFKIDLWEVESTSSQVVVNYSQRSGADRQDPAADLGARLFDPVFGGQGARLYAKALERSASRGRMGLLLGLSGTVMSIRPSARAGWR